MSMVGVSQVTPIQAQSSGVFSSVYLSPVRNVGLVGSVFTVRVLVNMTADAHINAFDVRINYSLPHVFVIPSSISDSNNIFTGFNKLPLRACIDNIAVNNTSNGCESTEGYGQIHFSQAILGTEVPGPIVAGLLFSVKFNVIGSGMSTFTLDRASLADPGDSNPSQANPHLIPDVTTAGFFANKGIVSFFNFEPTSSVAFLPGDLVVFDARASFDADNASMAIVKYSWNFGDGSSTLASSPVVNHPFVRTGNYSVSLLVTDAKNELGMPISWTVSIVREVGAITVALKTVGSPGSLTDPVTVKLFNSSISGRPFAQTSGTGDVSFVGLSAGVYVLTFSGASIENYSRTETVSAGLTTPVTVYLTLIPTPQSYVAEIFYGALAVAVGLLAGVIILRRVRAGKNVRSAGKSKRKLASISKK
jgi:hypothetical protein